MKLSERIRSHVIERHLRPAQERGVRLIDLRAGDIHSELHLSARLPAVCGAMGGAKLCEEAKVRLTSRMGPIEGANVWFSYALADGELGPRQAARPASSAVNDQPNIARTVMATQGAPDLLGALVLVSCTKSKRSQPTPARDLYCSTFFDRARRWIERRGAHWRILSAEHGLVDPDALIAPYDRTLTNMTIAQRRRWAARILDDLAPLAKAYPGIVFLAGQRYREFLMPALEAHGIACAAPMAHLAQGEQLAWLGRP